MKREENEIYETQRRQEYLQTRHALVELQNSSYKTFDKAILFLSSGAIAISVTVLEIKEMASDSIDLLFASWAFWLASLLFQLRTYLWSGSALEAQIIQCDMAYQNNKYEPKTTSYNKWIQRGNRLSLMFFALGSFVFLIFVGSGLV